MTTSPVCLRCLARPLSSSINASSSSTLRHGSRSTFSTSAIVAAMPPQRKASGPSVKGSGNSYKQGRIGGSGGKGRGGGGKPPAEGERKAMRKRIVLSNTNALEVEGLRDLSATNMAKEESQGQVLALSNEAVDALRALEAFKATQGWSMFRRPSTLITSRTHEIAKQIEELEGNKQTSRQVLTGERGSGKSVLALQAMAMAVSKGWVVINIPESQDLTLAQTSYVPTESNGETLYVQPHYVASLLSKIAKANHGVLSNLTLSKEHNLPIPIQDNLSLSRLAELGASDPDIAWPIYQALFTELNQPNRPPVLYALDNIAHVMKDSLYLDADLKPIHAHKLALVHHFMGHLSGAQTLSNGGMVIAADSRSNRPSMPTLDYAITGRLNIQSSAAKKAERLATQNSVPATKKAGNSWNADVMRALRSWNQYEAFDDAVADVLKTVQVVEVGGLSKDECRSIMEYYARSGMLRQRVDATLVGEKWTMAGGGIIGEVERGSVFMRV